MANYTFLQPYNFGVVNQGASVAVCTDRDNPQASLLASFTVALDGGGTVSLTLPDTAPTAFYFVRSDGRLLACLVFDPREIAALNAAPTAAAIRAEIDTNSTKLDATISSRLAASAYTAPDNAGIDAIQAKTDALPASPASTQDVQPTIAFNPTINPTAVTVNPTPVTVQGGATAEQVWTYSERELTGFEFGDTGNAGNGGNGAYQITFAVEDAQGIAVQGVRIELVGTGISGVSDTLGRVTLNLDAGTYTRRIVSNRNYQNLGDEAFVISADTAIPLVLTANLVPVSPRWW